MGHRQTTSAIPFWMPTLVSNWHLLNLVIFWIVVLRWMGENGQCIKVRVCSPQRKKFIITSSITGKKHTFVTDSVKTCKYLLGLCCAQHGFNAQMSSPGVMSGEYTLRSQPKASWAWRLGVSCLLLSSHHYFLFIYKREQYNVVLSPFVFPEWSLCVHHLGAS